MGLRNFEFIVGDEVGCVGFMLGVGLGFRGVGKIVGDNEGADGEFIGDNDGGHVAPE